MRVVLPDVENVGEYRLSKHDDCLLSVWRKFGEQSEESRDSRGIHHCVKRFGVD